MVGAVMKTLGPKRGASHSFPAAWNFLLPPSPLCECLCSQNSLKLGFPFWWGWQESLDKCRLLISAQLPSNLKRPAFTHQLTKRKEHGLWASHAWVQGRVLILPSLSSVPSGRKWSTFPWRASELEDRSARFENMSDLSRIKLTPW